MKIKKEHIGDFCRVRGLRLFRSDNPPLWSEYPFYIVGFKIENKINYVYLVLWNNVSDVWKIKESSIVLGK